MCFLEESGVLGRRGKMMRGLWSLFLLLTIACLPVALPAAGAVEPAIVRVSDWQSQSGTRRPDYFHDLFRHLLTLTEPAFGPVTVISLPDKLSQGRLLAELKAGRMDVSWSGTNVEREHDALPVRIPIDMGLIGQRVPIIRADRAGDFAKVRNVDDLRHFTACQGAQWPDADILAAAGLPQVTHVHFDQLYAMLRAGRCDYFARGLAEVADEFAQYGGPDLIVFDRLVIAYPMPVYFFVSPARPELARRLETGLRTMLADGSLRRMLSTHPSTRGAFPLERFRHATVIHLPNPTLPPETPLTEPGLWLAVDGTS
jgi:hypothetical protein